MRLAEPVLEIEEIQGNIEPGFRLPFQRYISLQLSDECVIAKLINLLLAHVVSMKTVIEYHDLRIVEAKRNQVFGFESYRLLETDFCWLNIHFGRTLLDELGYPQASSLDHSFSVGHRLQSATLGDKSDQSGWKLGKEGKETDILLLFASPSQEQLEQSSNAILAEAAKCCPGCSVVFDQYCARLNDDAEHFGFKDGISQPELRGMLETINGPGYYNPTMINAGNDDPDTPEYASAGKILVWPGQYFFGYPMQDPDNYRAPMAEAAAYNDPVLRNGSFMVLRRLNQRVAEFYAYAQQASKEAGLLDPRYNDPDYFLAHLVGRFKSGQPVIMGETPVVSERFNHFNFLSPIGDFQLSDGSTLPGAEADPLATKCPYFAHIRKVNPRDLTTNRGGAKKSVTFRMLRRGIPFGPAFDHTNSGNPINTQERGLLFVSYQTSISGQFELLLKDWANSQINPEGGDGIDLVIGQNSQAPGRERSATIFVNGSPIILKALDEFVFTTGGEYLFTPSIHLLKLVANK